MHLYSKPSNSVRKTNFIINNVCSQNVATNNIFTYSANYSVHDICIMSSKNFLGQSCDLKTEKGGDSWR